MISITIPILLAISATSMCFAISILYLILYFDKPREMDFALFSLFTLVVARLQLLFFQGIVFQSITTLFLVIVSFYSLFLIIAGKVMRKKVYYLYFVGALLLAGLSVFDSINANHVYMGKINIFPIGAMIWAIVGASIVSIFVRKANTMSDGTIHIIDEKKDIEDKGTLDITDPLTGLYNNEFLNENIEDEVKDSIKMNRSLSLLMIDIDKFDDVYKSLGKSISDYILSDISEIIRKTVKEADIPARCGDARFGIILPNTRITDAWEVGERLVKIVSDMRFVIEGKKDVFVTMSLGATELRGSDMAEDLVSRTLDALGSASDDGGNRITVLK
jgi:diguanylate cyclase (GGDEF)-like protein